MTYQLGVDLGTTYTAAAVHRDDRTDIFELGNRTSTIPSVIFLGEDGTILTGEAANRRGVTEPNRVAREFKRRIGDPTPILLGGSPYSAEALSAKLLSWVIERVSEREGSHPSRVAVTHPANWGPYKLDLLQQAVRMANLEDVVTLTEPEAAAIHYSTLERIEPGMVVAVFDLGGGTFDAATLKKNETGFEFLGRPEGIERLGGIDFDEAVFGFVARSLGGALQELDPSDPTAVAAVARLRAECVEAKEALSGDTEATIPVVLPNVQTDIRITRSEFEQLIRPSLADAIEAMRRAVRSADLEMDQVDLILLVGGSSRIPLIGQMVGGELGRPVAVDAHPKHSIALGASLAAAEEGATHPVTASATAAAAAVDSPDVGVSPVTEADDSVPSGDSVSAAAQSDAAATVAAAAADDIRETVAPTQPASKADDAGSAPPPADPPQAAKQEKQPDPKPLGVASGNDGGGGPNKGLLIGIAAVVVAAIVGAIVFLGGGGDDDPDVVAGGSSTTEESSTTEDESATTTEATTTTTEATTTTTEPTTTTQSTTTTSTEPPFVCDAGFCASIDEVEVVNGELIVEWTPYGFEPDVSNIHVHFYYDVFDAAQVGTNFSQWGESVQGFWELTQEIPFETAGTAVSMASLPADATALCVTPTDSAHGVLDPEHFDCVDIPEEILQG